MAALNFHWWNILSVLAIGGRDIKYFWRRYPISGMNIALSDIGQKIGVVLNDKIKSWIFCKNR
jgi:hypothetical protein